MLPEIRAAFPKKFFDPVVRLLARMGITPNMITWVGLILCVASGGLAGSGQLAAAGWVSLIGGGLDMFDGALARMTGQTSKFGALLDSTLDRYGEAVLLVGVMAYYAGEQAGMTALMAGLALMGSFMVSYVKARAEGLDIACDVGFFTRPERVVVLGLGLAVGFIELALVVVAVAANVTAFQRLIHVWRALERQ
jgi:CDP-diacylglycerol--glycerol-3-phosphate 3-phosphatidyltransferase